MNTEIFRNLYIQIASKNSIFFRVLKSKPVRWLTAFDSCIIEVPDGYNDFIGLVKEQKIVLFALEKGSPIKVFKGNNGNWKEEAFLGYQLISDYSLEEFNLKKELIEQALEIQWRINCENSLNGHGDLTHFNILIAENNRLKFIDQKESNRSRIYDIYYFYAYLSQCLFRCKTLNKKDTDDILLALEDIIFRVCGYSTKTDVTSDFNLIEFPEVSGLNDPFLMRSRFLAIFSNLPD